MALSAALALCVAFASSQAPPTDSAAPQGGTTSRPELALQTGHTGLIYAVAFSPDGRILASGSDDNTIILWDVKTAVELRSLVGHTRSVYSVAFSPDGLTLASGSLDGTTKLWDVGTGSELRTLTDHTASVECVAFSPDGRILASGGEDRTIRLRDVASAKTLLTLNNDSEVFSIAFSPDGRTLASGSSAKTIQIWDVASGRELRTLHGRQIPHKHDPLFNPVLNLIRSVAFSPDARTLASAAEEDNTIDLWNLDSGQQLRTLAGHTSWINSLTFSPDGRILASGGAILDGTTKVWDVASGRELRSFPGHTGGVAFSRNGRILAWGSDGNAIKLWDTDHGTAPRTMAGQVRPIESIAFSLDGRMMAAASDTDVKLWDMAGTRGLLNVFSFTGQAAPMCVAISPDSRVLAAGSNAGTIRLWDALSGHERRELPPLAGHTTRVSSVAFSPDGSFLASASDYDSIVRLWEVTSGRERLRLDLRKGTVASVVFSPDGRMLAAAGGNVVHGTVTLWDVMTGSEFRSLTRPDALGIQSIAFSPDGRILATARLGGNIESIGGVPIASGSVHSVGHSATITLWDVASGQEIRALPGDSRKQVNSVAFKPDSHMLISGGSENTVKLWDIATGQNLRTFNGHTAAISSVAFSPDGRLVLSASTDGTVRVWDPESGRQLAALISLSRVSDWLVVTPDGLFDGSPGAWNQILWRFNGNTFDVAPVELFFNEYYYPGLLADIMAGKNPKAATSIENKDRRQPQIQLSVTSGQGSAGKPIAERELKLKLEVNEASADKDHPGGSGAQDVRLFRNGSLVKMWHGAVKLDAQGRAALETTVRIVAGENQFTAYGFNHDNIKSGDATLTVTGADALMRKGTAYILAIGVDHYANQNFDLRYAVADAQAFAQELKAQQEKLGNFARVEVMPLTNAQATRANILAAFAQLAPNARPLPASAPPALSKLQAAQPEDAVFIYFAGHGTADGPRFYLIPHDLGYSGARDAIDEAAMKRITQHSISDEELDAAFETVDAARMVLIIDACNSGQALEAEEKRRGPMNSKGLAQLAYEKGMYILTAAQGYQQAQESNQLGHGLLTYALVEEGLKQGKAAATGQSNVNLREWLDYAVQEVPQLQMAWLQGKPKGDRAVQLKNGAKAGDPVQLGMQRPRVFYRREPETQPFIIAQGAAKP